MPDICLWNKCNNRCIMCTNSEEFSNSNSVGNYDLKTQIKKFEMFLNGKKVFKGGSGYNSYINITGGEPTIHPCFFELIGYIRKRAPDMPITLLTNARMFSKIAFTQKFIKLAKLPFTVAINFPSYKKSTFEKITNIKGSYKETLKGIDNLFKIFNGRIEFRIVIHKLNIYELKKTVEFLLKRYKNYYNFYIVIIHYEIEGMSDINNKLIELKIKDSAKYINKNLKYLIKKSNVEIRLYHYPLCLLNKDLRKHAWITLPSYDRIYTKKCERCSLRDKCLGLMKSYYKRYNDYEIKPL
jgi:molybdenum cofactor biosynthesis enzyme MoaA